MKPSLRSRLFFQLLNVINFKKSIERRALKEIADNSKEFPPYSIKKSFKLIIQQVDGHALATYESKKKVTKNHIIFLHGGAYIFKTFNAHWRLTKKIVRRSYCRISHIDYPLAPVYNYRDTFNMLSGAYELLLAQYSDNNFIFMGDSAGGGLALAFAQKLAMETPSKLPSKMVLLSPWLDISMSNPDINKLEQSDVILTKKMLQYAAKKYSSGDNQDQYMLSPINGKFSKLPKSLVFYGTEELFFADCEKLKNLVSKSAQNFLFRKFHKMQHDWAIFPIPESRQVVNEVIEFITIS